MVLISIVVPSYNEKSNIPFFYNNFPQELHPLPSDYKIKLINDAASAFKLNGISTSFYVKGLKRQPDLLIGFSNEVEYDAP